MSVRTAIHSPRLLRTEVLGGLVVGLALIPEAISFSVIAGVDPRVGLFSAVTMAIAISVVGGRPAMISARHRRGRARGRAGREGPRPGGQLVDSIPPFGLPDVPWTWHTLDTIAPYALAMALVGLMESLMTSKFVDDLTDTHSDKNRESWGQGVANIVTGLFGGMGGCAMIGQTMINVRQSGARTRISTFLAGAFLLASMMALGDVVGRIPMAALAAVMIMVAIGTFDWHSLRTLRRMPRSETTVMVVTVVVVVATSDLAIGVVVGVIVAALLFARRVAHLADVERELTSGADGAPYARYRVTGELFFASSNDFYAQFDYAEAPGRVVIDFTDAHIWDASTVAALDAVTTKYRERGADVEVRGLNEASAAMYERLSGHLAPA